jgi:hypothetical protein
LYQLFKQYSFFSNVSSNPTSFAAAKPKPSKASMPNSIIVIHKDSKAPETTSKNENIADHMPILLMTS